MLRTYVLVLLLFFALSMQARVRQYSDLPTLHVMQTGEWHEIDKENYLDCEVELVDGDVTESYPDGRIRGRGNSTWVRGNKKPYRLKFYTKYKLLGVDRANAKNWVLLANNFDKTLIRNAVASHVASECGQVFTPGVRFVDMVLDGKFIGNYQITDFLDIRKKRINITEQELPAAEGDNITGGYFLECCHDETGPDVFYSDMGSSIRIKSPDEDVINKAQADYIRNHINEFERRIYGKDYLDPVKGYRPMVDSLSLASWYIAGELCMNLDMFWSTNIYKEKDDDRIFFGPVWDFDIGFNNSQRAGEVTEALMKDVGFHGYDIAGAWVRRMWTDPWFQQLVYREYMRIIDGGLEEHTLLYIDQLAAQLDQSQRLNYELYHIGEAYWDEYQLFSTYLAGVEFLKESFKKHIEFLNAQFYHAPPEPSPYILPQVAGTYTIRNDGADMMVNVKDNGLVISSEEMQWHIVPHGDSFRILSGELAVTGGQAQASPLTLQPIDETDTQQLWDIEMLPNSLNSCVVVNVATGWAWNNNGGHAEEGNPLISWTNDRENPNKPTRQWCFLLIDEDPEPEPEEPIEEPEDGLGELEQHFAITYSPSARKLRFIAYGYEALQGELEIYSVAGAKVFASVVMPEVDLSSIQKGNYILKVKINNQVKTLKIQL